MRCFEGTRPRKVSRPSRPSVQCSFREQVVQGEGEDGEVVEGGEGEGSEPDCVVVCVVIRSLVASVVVGDVVVGDVVVGDVVVGDVVVGDVVVGDEVVGGDDGNVVSSLQQENRTRFKAVSSASSQCCSSIST